MAFGFIRDIFDKVAVLAETVRGGITGFASLIRERLPAHGEKTGGFFAGGAKPRVVFALGALAVGALTAAGICIAAALARGRAPITTAKEPPGEHPGTVIPAEEIFLPPEPDFLPQRLLERERRTAWTQEDAEPFWTDPLTEGREPYEALVRRAVDGIMERIP
ncbi:MAG: hypothetical protein LBC88_06310 [Spirochaetaceae bacterium]|nr:hypothetical protein [Spirochaetaceae bacterium]